MRTSSGSWKVADDFLPARFRGFPCALPGCVAAERQTDGGREREGEQEREEGRKREGHAHARTHSQAEVGPLPFYLVP